MPSVTFLQYFVLFFDENTCIGRVIHEGHYISVAIMSKDLIVQPLSI